MVCPACHEPVPEGSRFCPACGHALAARPDERRVVTVLFADLVGFTALSEGRDPERIKNVVVGAFDRLTADVESHGGRVDNLVGDGLVALFGAPVAHEDDAERAVRAGLQMQRTIASYADELGAPLQLRIGVNTGEVLIGGLRAGGDVTAMGDTVNVASRLQGAAAPGQVVVGPLTHEQTSAAIRYESLGSLDVRGREQPVVAHVALASVAPPGSRPRRARLPFVGRDDEMRLLSVALDAAVRKERAHLVVLTGEAGIGKRRLAEELARIAECDVGARVLQTTCVPYGEARLWWPLADAVRQALGGEDDDLSADRISAFVDKLVGEAGDRAAIVDGLLHLLDLPGGLTELDPSRARDVALTAVLSTLEAASRRGPLVLIVSEAHWADDVVFEFVDRATAALASLPLFIVVTGRPELADRWTPAAVGRNLLALTIEPLSRDASLELLAAAFERQPAPERVEFLYDRSGGNPLFLEELARLVGDDGTAAELPATLRGLVATRLDSLDRQDRRVLEDAAVVGRMGTIDTLAALADGSPRQSVEASVRNLIGRQLLEPAERGWAFRSELVRDVAYDTLSKAERARRHARLAAWLQEQPTAASVEEVAHHMGAAAQLASEIGRVEGLPTDLADRAVEWVERAAQHAARRDSPFFAERLYDQALALIQSESHRPALLVGRARARGLLRRYDDARADVAAARSHPDCDARCRAETATVLGQVEQAEGRLDDSAATLDDALGQWRELGDAAGEAEALRLRGMTDLFRGRIDDAEQFIEHARDLFAERGDRRGVAWALQNLAWIAFHRGDPADADRKLDESLAAFEEIHDRTGRNWVLGLRGWIRLQQGHLEEAEALGEKVLKEAVRSNDRWAEAMMRVLIASARLWLGDPVKATERASEARRLFGTIDDAAGQLRALAALLRGHLASGQPDLAFDALDEALAIADDDPDPANRWFGRFLAALALVQAGRGERALEVAESVGARRSEGAPHAGATAVAGALLLVGRDQEATTLLSDGYRSAREPGDLAAIGGLLALALAVEGRAEQAIDIVAQRRDQSGTYLDHILLDEAEGFARARSGEVEPAVARLSDAVARADATDDVLAQALTRLARGHLLAATTGDRRDLDEAHHRLDAMGLGATDWDNVFARAAASTPAA